MNQRKRIVILGTGFAAISLVKKIDLTAYEVMIVSPRNHFLFTPLLPSTTVGTVEFRSIIEPVRKTRKGIEYMQGSCRSVDTERRTITCEGVDSGVEFTMEYHHLVIAVGAWNNTFNVPGVREHARFLKEVTDARVIREQVISCLERADIPGISMEERNRLLHFVVVGGGPTGIEFAAELHDLIEEDLGRSYPHLKGEVKISLFEAMNTILNSFDGNLRRYTAEHFKRQGIELRVGTPVQEVLDGGLKLKNGEMIPAGLIVWSTGYGPTGLAQSLPFDKDRSGRILVDECLRVPAHPEIYALGDCSNIAGNAVPQTAQLAMQQGKYLAKALNAIHDGESPKPFKFNNLGMLAYVGESKALADIPKANIRWRGLITYIFWRSAYFTRLIGFKNKVLVLFDWIKTAVFGRDLSKF
ncbi:MAG: putative dehydrogenase [Chlorobi bacterium]|nr:putative dehydrogenase [Chlorobiota bacterium]